MILTHWSKTHNLVCRPRRIIALESSDMEEFVAKALKMMGGNPSQIGDAFGAKLTSKDELLLSKIDVELGIVVESILDHVLAGANYNGEMSMGAEQRERVLELTAIRRAIHVLLHERGSLRAFREGLN